MTRICHQVVPIDEISRLGLWIIIDGEGYCVDLRCRTDKTMHEIRNIFFDVSADHRGKQGEDDISGVKPFITTKLRYKVYK